jgi:hypothetical protein
VPPVDTDQGALREPRELAPCDGDNQEATVGSPSNEVSLLAWAAAQFSDRCPSMQLDARCKNCSFVALLLFFRYTLLWHLHFLSG